MGWSSRDSIPFSRDRAPCVDSRLRQTRQEAQVTDRTRKGYKRDGRNEKRLKCAANDTDVRRRRLTYGNRHRASLGARPLLVDPAFLISRPIDRSGTATGRSGSPAPVRRGTVPRPRGTGPAPVGSCRSPRFAAESRFLTRSYCSVGTVWFTYEVGTSGWKELIQGRGYLRPGLEVPSTEWS